MEDQNSTDSDVFGYQTSLFVRVPMRRVGVVIGVSGTNLKTLKEVTNTEINVNSDTGEVEIRPGEGLTDPVQIFYARDMIKAIGRGFTPEQALQLQDDNKYLEVLQLKKYINTGGNNLNRVRARLIGTKGRTRKTIEKLTKVSLVISGSTVSLIGTYKQLNEARDAVEDIINGAKIEAVLGKLEEYRREVKETEQELWEAEEEFDIENLYPEDIEEEEDIFADFEEEE